MKQLSQKMKSLFLLLVMLCVSMTAIAETVEINGVFYNLQNGWTSYYYDSNGNYQDGTYYERAAFVTYDPSIDWSVNNRETYQGDVVIPDKVTKDGVEYPVVAVDYSAFRDCKSLTSVQLPSSVVKISDNAFSQCSTLTSVTMPGAQVLEGSGIFYGTKITSLAFPKTLKSINSSLYKYMSNLTSITIEEGSDAFKSVDGVLYDKKITKIVGYPAKKGGNYTIPATITTVSSGSFPDNISIDELIVPATVTKIENNAFGSNPQIKKLTIEDGTTELIIGTGNNSTWFYDDKGNSFEIYPMFMSTLTELYWGRPLKYTSAYSSPFASSTLNKVTFSTNVTSIPKNTFYNCYSLNTVDVKGGIVQWLNFDFTEFGTSPFSYAMIGGGMYPDAVVMFNGSGLSGTVVVPDDVTSIPSHGFQYGCSGITDLTLPAGVTSIADGAFKGLSSLRTIQLAAANTNYIVDDNVLYNIGKTKLLCFPQLREGEYTMPSTITTMGDYQFYNCNRLTKVTLSDKLTTINQYAFAGCSQLTSVIIPESVESIANNSFEDCTKLESIPLPSKLKEIGQYAFNKCKSLSSLTIPASVEKINDNALDSCIALTSLVIEDATTPLLLGKGRIEYKYETWTDRRQVGLFATSPIKDLRLGRNIEFIDDNKNNYYNSTLSPFYSEGNINGTYYNNANNLSSVYLGIKVTKIPSGFFYNCGGIKNVNYDGTLTDWCNITFADEYSTPFGSFYEGSPVLNLKAGPLASQVVIPDGTTKIGAYAFYGQSGVINVTIPSTMRVIEPYALPRVNDVYINATDIISLENTNSFGNNTNIYVLDEVATNYKSAAIWSDIKDRIYPKGFLTVTVPLIAVTNSPALLPALDALEKENGEYKITALTNLKIVGTMNGYDILMIRNKMPNLRHLDLSEAEIIDNDGGFQYYQGYNTRRKAITPYMFYGLTNLKTVYLPEDIETIEDRAFSGSGITSMVINEGVKSIGYYAFAECNNLSELTIGRGLEYIYSSAFQSCGQLRELVLPTTLKRIDSNAFQWCYNLRKIDFAEGLTDIGYSAFQGCSSLQDLKLPTSLRRIESYAFQNCSSLNVVHVPSMLESIGDYAFTGCGLSAVYAYKVVPVPINQNTFNYKGVDLYAPDNSFYKYYLNTQWSQFQDVKEFEAIYTDWCTARDEDIEIDTKKPIKGDKNIGYLYPGSGLIITGDAEQFVKKLILQWGHGDNYPSLVDEGNLNVDELAFIMNMYPKKWYFFCFPCDMNIKNLKFSGSGKYVWRYYDPEKRKLGLSGWTNFTGDVLKAGVGYIYQCSVEGTIELPAVNPEYLIRNDGTADDRDVNLISTEATDPQDASWNFVGNPNLSYYSLDDLAEDFNSPITVWNDENQTYEAVVPGDDDYDIHPFQAFFIQKPTDSEEVTFKAENRATYNQATEKAAARRRARATRAVDENHMIINVEISDGKSTDKTRVVFDDSKSFDYEIGFDANKMMSMAEVPQVYTLDNRNVKYSVNNRPNKGNEVRLGFSVPADGNYTISAPHMDIRMALKDKATGTIHDFSEGAYTFQAEAGSNDTRFALILAIGTTGISDKGIEGLDITTENGGISVNGITNQPVNIYNVKGIRVATLIESGNVNLANGTYIVSTGNKNTKILVK